MRDLWYRFFYLPYAVERPVDQKRNLKNLPQRTLRTLRKSILNNLCVALRSLR